MLFRSLVKSGVSRKHIVIDKMESGIGVQDLDSTNGTYINGQRIMPESLVKIKHGDELRIGVCTYILSSSVSSMTKK